MKGFLKLLQLRRIGAGVVFDHLQHLLGQSFQAVFYGLGASGCFRRF